MAGYGYDWAEGEEGETVTYQQALANAKQYRSAISFDNSTFNNSYSYTDGDGTKHTAYFTDAATTFNVMRFSDEYGTAGTALWRLGSEDERMWTFYNRDLDNASIQNHPFDFSSLKIVQTAVEKPDYIGDGEVLNVVTEPTEGIIDIETSPTEGLITEQAYRQLPTRYVIQKFGTVRKPGSVDI